MSSDTPHKGIMLAERPVQTFQQKAFLPACAMESLQPLGLAPAKKVHAVQHEATPTSISFYYRRWLQEMQQAEAQQREAQRSVVSAEQQKKESVAAFGEKLRATILAGGNVADFWKAADTDKGRTRKAETSVPATASDLPESSKQLLQDIHDFVKQEANASSGEDIKSTQSTHPGLPSPPEGRAGQQPAAAAASTSAPAPKAPEVRPGTSGSSKGRKAASSKPAWALSEEEASAKQMEEELELLDFADNLDFDTFVQRLDDVELQDTFQALQEAEQDKGGDAAWRKSFVRALNHVAFKQVQGQQQPQDQVLDNQSEAGRSEGAASRATHTSRARSDATAARLAAMAGKQDGAEDKWDSTSRAGDAKTLAAASKLQAAEEFLLENPELKGVHSNASVRAMLLKSEQQVMDSAVASH